VKGNGSLDSTVYSTTSGTVTNFITSGLATLFTASVSNPTTTPNLTFSAISESANQFYASPDNITGVPLWRSLVVRDFNFGTNASATTFWRGDGVWAQTSGQTISLTTIGTNGPATLVSSILNIPNYGSSLSAYVPYTGATTNVILGSNNITAGLGTFSQLNINIPTYTTGILNLNGTLLIVTSGAVPISLSGAVMADFESSTNNYTQVNLRNTSSGNNASSDWIATADTGTDSTNYIDVGINNSGFSQPGTWTINGALDGYVYTQSSNLAVGTASASNVDLFTGGTLAANRRMRFDGIGNWYMYGFSGPAGVFYGSATGQVKQTTSGTTGQILTIVGGIPTWANNTSGGTTTLPGGITPQVQYNSSGSTFAGAGLVNIAPDGNLLLVSTTSSTSGTTGTLKVYSNNQTGIDELHVIPDIGIEASVQLSFGQKIIGLIMSNNGAVTGYGNYIGSVSFSGGSANVNKSYDATNLLPNYSYFKNNSGSSTNSSADIYISQAGKNCLIGNNNFGAGSKLVITFGLNTYATTQRIFAGYNASAAGALATTTDPSAWLNTIGVGKDAADTTLQVMYNAGAGTATKVNTSITPNANDVYRVTIYILSTGTTSYVTLERITKGTITTFNSSNTAKIPAAGTAMYPHVYCNTGASSVAVNLAFMQMEEEQY
jgi:hypothetical protein